MSKISLADRNPAAGSGAPFNALHRITTFFAILAFVIQTPGITGWTKVRTARPAIFAAPASAPPEPFVVHRGTYSDQVFSSITKIGSIFAGFISGRETPAGLENAKVASRYESVYSAVSSLLLFIEPSNVSPATSAPHR
jgi:hypothetical protein